MAGVLSAAARVRARGGTGASVRFSRHAGANGRGEGVTREAPSRASRAFPTDLACGCMKTLKKYVAWP